MYASLALISLAFEAVCGYPQWLFQVLGHPVSWIGTLIARCEKTWNGTQLTFARRRLNGVMTLLVVLGAVLLVSSAVALAVDHLLPEPWRLIVLAILASALIAQRSLYQHVKAVAEALEQGGVKDGRQAVSMIVGRDTTSLDEHAISRAAIESLSENFSDGIVAPVFWLVVGGLPGAAAYKAINTADSMIGHRSDRYLAFGWAAARLDDIVNVPASRLSALWIAAAAALLPGMSGAKAIKAVFRDARRHRSPNAGWPEAAMAGALELRLAGPRVYAGEVVADPWMGDGREPATSADIRRALGVYRVACIVQAAAIAVLAMVLSFY